MKGRQWIIVITVLALLLGLIDWYFIRPLSTVKPVNESSFDEPLFADAEGFGSVTKPRQFSFPRDHGAHPRYRTEWWYFTGNLATKTGRKFGYELTFFRFALTADTAHPGSAWRSNQMYMAHLALTDVEDDQFYADERFSRAGNNLAGARTEPFRVWLYDWSAASENRAFFPLRLKARNNEFSIDLILNQQKPFVLQGHQGLSQKSKEPGNASYYYSNTRMPTTGTIRNKGKSFGVTGNSWMDREWSTSALSKEQVGWDWFALQLSDSSDIMFYQFRRRDGQPDTNGSGALFLEDGAKIPLNRDEVTITVLDHWTSPHTTAVYPSRWRLSIPSRGLELEIIPLINDQELNLRYDYWEGAVAIKGTRKGQTISGQGYVELTGYGETVVR